MINWFKKKQTTSWHFTFNTQEQCRTSVNKVVHDGDKAGWNTSSIEFTTHHVHSEIPLHTATVFMERYI